MKMFSRRKRTLQTVATEDKCQLPEEGASVSGKQDVQSTLLMVQGSRSMEDLRTAIQTTRKALVTAQATDSIRPHLLLELAKQLCQMYTKTKAIYDINEAVSVSRQAIGELPASSPTPAARFNTLRKSLELRYSVTHSMADLKEIIKVTKSAISATPQNEPGLDNRLNVLRVALKEKFALTQDMGDLEELLKFTVNWVAATPEGHTARRQRLNELATVRTNKLVASGSETDAFELVDVLRQIVNATPNSHPGRTKACLHLRTEVVELFRLTGELPCLTEAIQITKDLLRDASMPHDRRVELEYDIAYYLKMRYMRLSRIADLEESIAITQKCLDAYPEHGPLRAAYLNMLGSSLRDRYSRLDQIHDLKTAICVTREAIAMSSENDPGLAGMLGNLGNILGDLYYVTHDISDLEEAISLAQKAVKDTPGGSRSRRIELICLANRLEQHHFRTGLKASLDGAMNAINEAIDITSEDDIERAWVLNKAGLLLRMAYSVTLLEKHYKDAVEAHWKAVLSLNSSSVDRIRGGRFMIDLCLMKDDWTKAYRGARMAMNQISRLIPNSLENADKQFVMGVVFGLAPESATVVLRYDSAINTREEQVFLALEILEQGRGVLSASIELMRTDVTDLHKSYPDLAEQLIHLRERLQLQSRHNDFVDESSRTYEAGEALDELLRKIRATDEFSKFGVLPSENDILSAAQHGPIVVINVSKHGCDAILIEAHQVRALPLLQLKKDDIDEKVRRRGLDSLDVLGWMWDTITGPILDALGITNATQESPPHVCWIATGSLSRFPLHAAGHHYKGSTRTVLDRVISSYSSSIRAIVNSRRNPLESPIKQNKALLIAMDDTPEHSPLYFAAQEVKELRVMCESMQLQPVEPRRHKQDVLSHLKDCKIFHFAGHGNSKVADPSQSYLLLDDWKSDRLTVSALQETNVRQHFPFLAYLSACGTGQIQDEKFTDEAIHLASAFQLAGFRHVIGSLWEVNDRSCVDIARITYEEIKEGGMVDSSVSRGLHKALKTLRDQWLESQCKAETADETIQRSSLTSKGDHTYRNESTVSNDRTQEIARDVTLLDDDDEGGSEVLHWVPYVHYGA